MSEYYVKNREHQALTHIPALDPALGPREVRKIHKKTYDLLIDHHHQGTVILIPDPDRVPDKHDKDEASPPPAAPPKQEEPEVAPPKQEEPEIAPPKQEEPEEAPQAKEEPKKAPEPKEKQEEAPAKSKRKKKKKHS